eukprot:CAMPEP_0180657734 /NCGR_PEP_ID=MMETSP1037_2-20121125/56587_1 /TAXON_ID=632150 /ORGANISM="Azadinium spinosum, Strain 3D9" /LENGTH=90 /DNA_ID=CAMNT_0022684491 /DNA_START=143 /DNA_END=412 /DNA_ORIENTATION=-
MAPKVRSCWASNMLLNRYCCVAEIALKYEISGKIGTMRVLNMSSVTLLFKISDASFAAWLRNEANTTGLVTGIQTFGITTAPVLLNRMSS